MLYTCLHRFYFSSQYNEIAPRRNKKPLMILETKNRNSKYIRIEILLQIYPKPTMIWYIPICRPKYPLVNVYITIENGHRNNELSHKNRMVIFHICCMFTRGYYMVWPQNKWEYINKYHNAIIWYISLYELIYKYHNVVYHIQLMIQISRCDLKGSRKKKIKKNRQRTAWMHVCAMNISMDYYISYSAINIRWWWYYMVF